MTDKLKYSSNNLNINWKDEWNSTVQAYILETEYHFSNRKSIKNLRRENITLH